MRTKGAVAAGVVLAVAVSGCSSGAAKVLVQHSDRPFPSSSPSVTASASASGAARLAPHHRVAATGTPAPSASAVAVSTAPRRTTAPPPTRSAAPAPAPKVTATRVAACSGGTTNTIQMTSPYRFNPATLAIKRCDSVRAVYADSTGAPHNWKGPSWSSPDMSSSGQSYTYRFTSTGTFHFYCSYHQSLGMTGTITVS